VILHWRLSPQSSSFSVAFVEPKTCRLFIFDGEA
jgi:hypothetical protein